uniref:Uncharacterized protein n=1 Tax=Musa acuminata subsp. malaccensis TaxID=214687 RepID=A0A804U651_MUSAM
MKSKTVRILYINAERTTTLTTSTIT